MLRNLNNKNIFLPVALTLAGLFALLASAVLWQDALTAFDTSIVQAIAETRTAFLLQIFLSLTLLGNTIPIFVTAIAATLLLWTTRHITYAFSLAIVVAGAKLSEFAFKLLIERARPEGFSSFHLDTFSFPSGHATASMALYGFLTYILIQLFPRQTNYIVVVGIALVLGIGMSRVYLGVHYPSDVLGGYLLGAMWVCAGIYLSRRAKQ